MKIKSKSTILATAIAAILTAGALADQPNDPKPGAERPNPGQPSTTPQTPRDEKPGTGDAKPGEPAKPGSAGDKPAEPTSPPAHPKEKEDK